MVTNLDGERVSYVGYREAKFGKEILYIYKSLTKGQQRRLEREAKKFNQTWHEYLEEIIIDVDKAIEISNMVVGKINKNLRIRISEEELALLLLFCGIGVYKRSPLEISFILGERSNLYEDIREYLKNTYGEYLDEIYDIVMRCLNLTNNYEKRL